MNDNKILENHSFSTIYAEQPIMEDNTVLRSETDQTLFMFEIGSIRVTNELEFPLELDVPSEVRNILTMSVFRNLENPAIYDKLCNMLLSERFCSLTKALFWVIFVVKFQKDDEEVLERLRKNLGKLYSGYFSLLEKPKEELSNLGIFGAAYLCQIMFFNLFQKDRDQFDMRFILDCYHIVIHEVNGIFVSDFYIQNSIERLFGNKFFHYEKRFEKKKKVEKRDFREEPLLRDLKYDLQHLPQVEGGLDLAYELSSKLRKVPKKLKSSTSGDSSELRNNIPGNRAILRLTQPPEEKSILSTSERNTPYFPKLKFNCHQISPTVSSFLDNTTNALPFQKKKVIDYSNNKHVVDYVQANYPHPSFQEPEASTSRIEKRDRKKQQNRGTVSDYHLKNRPDNYYLEYLPQDIKKKFKVALDMKYIFDHIKPNVRGSSSVKSFADDFSKKIKAFDLHHHANPQAINEEQEEEAKEGNEEEMNMINMSLDRDTSRREDILENKNDPKVIKTREETPSEPGLLPLVRSKTKPHLKDESLTPVKISSRKIGVLPRIDEPVNHTADYSDAKKNNLTPGTLKFYTAINRKLGKGRFFVSLTENDEGKEANNNKRPIDQFTYVNRKSDYVSEHKKLIKNDVDSNIENIVNRLMVKQNVFHKSFGRKAVSTLRRQKTKEFDL